MIPSSFDVDEAQEYTDDQENTLQYTVSDSYNPQIIMCGTPPTAVSSGTVFTNLRDDVLGGDTEDTGWAEWSVDEMSDVNDVDLWFETNPAMGYQLNERKVRAENKKDETDFNIQRLGLWIKYKQKSLITKDEWSAVCVDTLPKFVGSTFLGVKYGHDGNNVAVSVAVKTNDGRVFVECLDCQSMRNGDGWILEYIASMKPHTVIVDGKNGQQLLLDEAKARGLKKPMLPTTNDIITGSALFMQMLYAGEVIHMEQPSVAQIISNCDKRSIGSSGGYGFKSLNDKMDIAIVDSIVLALFACSSAKEKQRQQIKY